ncbi:MAG: hypothetical protein U1E23_02330 [Reyranellaceae bacterium]
MVVATQAAVAAPSPQSAAVVAPVVPLYLQWGPVILGTVVASAISIVLLTFGAALGLTGVSPYPYAGLSAKALGILSAVYALLVTVASFGAGGYVAGRAREPWGAGNLTETHFRDGAHGLGVWALAIVVGAALAMSGAAGAVKTVFQTTGAVAAAGAAGGAANPATGEAMSRLSVQPTDYAVDRLLAPGPATGGGDNAGPGAAGRDSRADLAAPVARAFAANLKNPQLDARDRTMLAQIVVQQTGMPQAEAEKRVDETFADLKAAEQKARDAAEAARKAALIAAFAAAAILAVACAAACGGAALGARHRDENTLVSLFGSRRLW